MARSKATPLSTTRLTRGNKSWSPSRSKKKWTLAGSITFALFFAFIGFNYIFNSQAAAANFVYRDGSQLMLNGAPYEFVGYNYFGATGCADGSPDSQAAIDSYFSGLRPLSTTRTWAFKPQGTAGIDRVIASAEKYNQKVIFALADGAQYCGDTGYNAAFYKTGYTGAYFAWIQQVVSKYKDSPAVLAWETMNEPCHSGTSGLDKTTMYNFFENTAKQIKTYDPNHLVFTGSLAEYDCGGALNDFGYVHSGPHIDGGSLHEYDYLSVGQKGASGHWNAVYTALKAINKVAYVGEVGVGPDGKCLSDSEMASAHKQKFDAYINANASGVLLWGFDDQKVCGIYSGRQVVLGDGTWNMTKSYTNPSLATPATSPTPTPTPTPPTPTPTPPVPVPTPIPPTPPTPTPTPTTPVLSAQVNEDAFSYTGQWYAATGSSKFKSGDKYSTNDGATYSYTFTGRQAIIYSTKAARYGIAAIKVDNGSETMVDLYAANRQDQVKVYTSPVLTSGSHKITVRVTGDNNNRARDDTVSADRIDIYR